MTESNTLKLYDFDISVEEKEVHKSSGFDACWLKLMFSGKDFSNKIAHALMRVTMNNVPSYAFPRELITIETNTTSAFNNDYMRLRLSQMPVYGIKSKIFHLPEQYWYKINYGDPTREKHPTEQSYEVYINSHNNSAEISNVTTNDIKVTIDGEEQMPYDSKYPILLLKLRPNDKFKCYMRASLGVGSNNIIWAPSRNSFFEEFDDDKKGKKYLFTIEGNNQCHEYEYMVSACQYMIFKLSELKDDLQKKISTKELQPKKIIHLKLDNEDHTLGEVLNYEFQNHPKIAFSGVTKPDHLVQSILFKITASDGIDTPLNPMLESVENLIHKFSHVGKLLEKLGSKYLPTKQIEKKSKK